MNLTSQASKTVMSELSILCSEFDGSFAEMQNVVF